MSLRVQPPLLPISAGEPFLNDRLGREESIKALTEVVRSVDGPCVLAVDASWGMGKTTFLRMWSRHLRDISVPVVDFNAWDTDFAEDPFLAMFSEMTNALEALPTLRGSAALARWKQTGRDVVRDHKWAIARSAVSAVPYVGDRIASELSPESSTPFHVDTARFAEARAARQDFRESLRTAAKAASATSQLKPLVVMIDELDRCRPNYAIKLLETAKHLFGVDGVVFVLCLDRQQLVHSIRAVYGEGFDAEGYLRRFFDIDYQLPHADRADFIAAALDNAVASIRSSNENLSNMLAHYIAEGSLPVILDRPTLSQRQILQTTRRLAVILSSIPASRSVRPDVVTTLLVLRTVNPELYRRYVTGHCTDEEAIATFSVDLELRNSNRFNARAAIEAVLLAGVCVFTANDRGQADYDKLPIVVDYLAKSDPQHISRPSDQSEQMYLDAVVGYIAELISPQGRRRPVELARVADQGGFRSAVRQLELFPDSVAGTGLAPRPDEA
ncbi:MAG: P-loop NTPase fold protein [Chloroflexi bacterium]|nr:P-loop NTPase fold protein [Chloroflexota bacterium]